MTTITALPTEIIVDIFSHLDYLTLHIKIRPVCTFFNNVITSTTSGPLGVKLLRAKQNDKNEYCFEFHPCIRKLVINLGLISTNGSKSGSTSTDRPQDIDPTTHIGFLHPTTKTFTPACKLSIWNEYILLPAVPARDFLPTNPSTPFLLSSSSKQYPQKTVGEFVKMLLDEATENFRHWRIRNKWELYYSGKSKERSLIDYRRIMGWIGSEVYGDKFCECFGTDVFAGVVSSSGQGGSGGGGGSKKGQRSKSGDRIVYQMGHL